MYVITGATGHTGSIIAHSLLKAGKSVTVVGRSADKLEELKKAGAQVAIGNLEDAAFLTTVFKGAKAVYALIPPNFATDQFRAYQNRVADALVTALKSSSVTHVVTLSSFGAHLTAGAGVVQGLYDMEQKFKALTSINVLHLRAGFFLENLFGSIGLLKQAGIFGGFPIEGNVTMSFVHTHDIAEKATHHLLNLDFTGQGHEFVAGDRDYTLNEVSGIVGAAIGKPELTWTRFPDADAYQGMVGMGVPADLAKNYVEFCNRANEGKLTDGFIRTEANTTKTSAADFAKEFAVAYQA
ncbi:MAG: NAD(P)H-binding protein [Bacteroidetes bacterium]|nr:NAD(P)H-binding protein [Bacteroidota bacterium]